jgi:hypothetical protein
MRRLGHEAAFAELDMAERTEHLVGDVRYTVWRCQACGTVEKRGATQDVKGLAAGAVAPPVGSAAFLRRRAQSGLSLWFPGPTAAPPSSPSSASQLPGLQRRPTVATTASSEPAQLRAVVEPSHGLPQDGA